MSKLTLNSNGHFIVSDDVASDALTPRTVIVYPATAAIGEWLECDGDGGVVNLPAAEDVSAGDTTYICLIGDPCTVQTSDGMTINGQLTYDLSVKYESYCFRWVGSEWRIS